MNAERLVTMANDIAAFFAGESDDSAAVTGIATHLTRYWEPRMRKQIVDYVQDGGRGLSPLAAEAVAKLATTSSGT